MNGQRPLVVPRIARFGEAVDDHQLAFGHRLAETGLVTLVTDPARLREALPSKACDRASSALPGAGPLAEDLATYLRSIVGETARDPDRRRPSRIARPRRGRSSSGARK
jgi:UDP-N-acetylglucosamine transferase subunit ALG13